MANGEVWGFTQGRLLRLLLLVEDNDLNGSDRSHEENSKFIVLD